MEAALIGIPQTASRDGKYLRIPAIHDVRPDMTHFKSNARLHILPMACNVIHVFED